MAAVSLVGLSYAPLARFRDTFSFCCCLVRFSSPTCCGAPQAVVVGVPLGFVLNRSSFGWHSLGRRWQGRSRVHNKAFQLSSHPSRRLRGKRRAGPQSLNGSVAKAELQVPLNSFAPARGRSRSAYGFARSVLRQLNAGSL